MSKPNEIIEAFIAEHPEVLEGTLTEQELNELLAQYQRRINDRPLEDFDGLSPRQMHILLHAPFSPESVLHLQKDVELHVEESPLFKLSEILLHDILAAGNLKLTVTGNLPVKICEALYSLNLIDSRYYNSVRKGTVREDHVPYLFPLKQYLLDEGIVKKRHNALSVTKSGEKYLKAPADERFTRLFLYFTTRFHWGNLYHLHDPQVYGQMGWAYSMVLFLKYGAAGEDCKFYSSKYARAFYPEVLDYRSEESESHASARFHHAYEHRFFECFCNWFGLVKIERSPYDINYNRKVTVTRTPLLDKLFTAQYR